jgi:hypothetical protein
MESLRLAPKRPGFGRGVFVWGPLPRTRASAPRILRLYLPENNLPRASGGALRAVARNGHQIFCHFSFLQDTQRVTKQSAPEEHV